MHNYITYNTCTYILLKVEHWSTFNSFYFKAGFCHHDGLKFLECNLFMQHCKQHDVSTCLLFDHPIASCCNMLQIAHDVAISLTLVKLLVQHYVILFTTLCNTIDKYMYIIDNTTLAIYLYYLHMYT